MEKGPLTITPIQSLLKVNLHKNTVSTFVRGLEKMRVINHSGGFKPYVYFAILKKEQYINWMINEIITTHFNGQKSVLVRYIINEVF